MSKGSMIQSLVLFAGSVFVSRAFLVARPPAARNVRSLQQHAAGMASLPEGVVKYSQVPKDPNKFTSSTIPKGLLKQHSTKKGTWGVIRVSKGIASHTFVLRQGIHPTQSFLCFLCVCVGTLEYQTNEPVVASFVIDSNTAGIIEPTVLHQVRALTDDLEFVVEFHRQPGTGPVDEKRE